MNRPIKFRAWDKIDNAMRTVAEVNFAGQWVAVVVDVGDGLGLEQRRFEDIELLQDCGLLDKNGKEIYEGDVLTGEQSIVSSDDPSEGDLRQVVFDEETAGFVAAYIDGNTRTSGLTLCKKNCESKYEVIGNIYENSQLLNV